MIINTKHKYSYYKQRQLQKGGLNVLVDMTFLTWSNCRLLDKHKKQFKIM